MDHYQQLAELALAQCPADFEARIEARLAEDFAEIGLYCVQGAENRRVNNIPAIATADMHDDLDAIREEICRLSGQKWSYCIFRVFPDHTFNLDVSYDGPLPGMNVNADNNS